MRAKNLFRAVIINNIINSTVQSINTYVNVDQKKDTTSLRGYGYPRDPTEGQLGLDTSMSSENGRKSYSSLNLLNKVTAKSKMPQLSAKHRDVQPPPTNPSEYSGIIGGKKDLNLLIAPVTPSSSRNTSQISPGGDVSNFANITKTNGQIDKAFMDGRSLKESEENKRQSGPSKSKKSVNTVSNSAFFGEKQQLQSGTKQPASSSIAKGPLKKEVPSLHIRNGSSDSNGSIRSGPGSNRSRTNQKNIENSLNQYISTISKEKLPKQVSTKELPGVGKKDRPSHIPVSPNSRDKASQQESSSLQRKKTPGSNPSSSTARPSLEKPENNNAKSPESTQPAQASSPKRKKVNLQLLSEYEMYFGKLIEAPPSKPHEVFNSYQKLARVSFVFDFTEFETGFKDMKVRNCIKSLFFFEKISTFVYCAKRKTLTNDMVLRAILHYAYKGFILFIELLFSKLPAAHQTNEFLISIRASINRRKVLFGLPTEPQMGDSYSSFKQINDVLLPLLVGQFIPGTRLQEKISAFCHGISDLSFYQGISSLARMLGIFPGEQVSEEMVDKYYNSYPAIKKENKGATADPKESSLNSGDSPNKDNSISVDNSQNISLLNSSDQIKMNETIESLTDSVTIQEENEEEEDEKESQEEKTNILIQNSKQAPSKSGNSSSKEKSSNSPPKSMINLKSAETVRPKGQSSKTRHKIREPFLPPNTDPPRKFTLVLDLDETLVHFEEVGDMGQFFIRPYAKEFIDELSLYYEVVVFTAAMQDYADWVLDRLDTERSISHRLYRQHTVSAGNTFIKDLSLLGRNLEKTIIVDNVAENFQMQPDNGIFIKSWFNDPLDKALLELLPLLKEIVVKNAKDARLALRSFRDQMIENIKNNIADPHLNLHLELNTD